MVVYDCAHAQHSGLSTLSSVCKQCLVSSLLMSPKAANTSNAAKPAGSSAEKSGAPGDVTNQRKLLPLSHLNAQSARVGLWEVMIWKPKDTTHSYLWEGKGRRRMAFNAH